MRYNCTMENYKADLVIFGGGINGLSLARLAALAGKSVVLIEFGDFMQGASSATSKLIHGGLRYLEHWEWGLVKESTRERKYLLESAPHLVKEARFVFPLGSFQKRTRLAVKSGLRFYDLLAGSYALPKHEFWNKSKLLLEESFFLPDSQKGAYMYSDCQGDDTRLGMEQYCDAKSHGAQLYNYIEVLQMQQTRGALLWHVRNRITGKEFTINAPQTALTLGAWTDSFVKQFFPESSLTQLVLPSQGTHLLVRKLPIHNAFILPVPKSDRYFFVLPWKGQTLIGTTESKPLLNDGTSTPTDLEVQELLELTRLYFPRLNPRVLCAFAGVRPLAYRAGSTVSASRTHRFSQIHPLVMAGVGGKFTTHRTFAQEFYCSIFEEAPPSTYPLALPGAKDWKGSSWLKSEILQHTHPHPHLLNRWIESYGMRSLEVARQCAGTLHPKKSLADEQALPDAEIDFLIKEEGVMQPEDLLRRRSDFFFHEDAGLQHYPRIEARLKALIPHYYELKPYKKMLKENKHAIVLHCP
jgi:glycerol-3-phosphate dehydrogenase